MSHFAFTGQYPCHQQPYRSIIQAPGISSHTQVPSLGRADDLKQSGLSDLLRHSWMIEAAIELEPSAWPALRRGRVACTSMPRSDITWECSKGTILPGACFLTHIEARSIGLGGVASKLPCPVDRGDW